MATILRCGLLGYESLTTMITEFRKFNCTTHLLLLVAVCCWVVLLGALFRLTSIKLICGQQNSQLGNNWATNISKKVELGNKKEKEKCTETQQKQALNKQKKVNYFPIQIVKLKCKALSIKGFRGCVFIWATTGQQNPLKQVQVQHKEKKIFSLV